MISGNNADKKDNTNNNNLFVKPANVSFAPKENKEENKEQINLKPANSEKENKDITQNRKTTEGKIK